MQTTLARALLFAALLLSPALPVWAAPRQRVELRPSAPPLALAPAAAAPAAMSAPVLSGLDYTAIAPPGVRLRVVEDEPYIYLLGGHAARLTPFEGVTRITLRSDIAPGEGRSAGFFEARVNLRGAFAPQPYMELLDAFDAAADSAYRRAMLTSERRGALVYELDEVRSPLGLSLAEDPLGAGREYLSYNAEVVNPDNPAAANEGTPYQFVNGELKAVRLARPGLYLLTVSFEAAQYPHALALVENIARCVLNRLDPRAKPQQRLSCLPYSPEYEVGVPEAGESLDPRVADLAEQPGEGCGVGQLPVQGDRCPACQGAGPFAPAKPYAGGRYGQLVAERLARAICSHCLLAAPGARLEPPVKSKVPKKAVPKDAGCAGTQPEAPACPLCGKRHRDAVRQAQPAG